MKSVLRAFAVVMLLAACGDDEKSKVGYLQECTSTPRTDCDGAAAAACPNDTNCQEGLDCRPVAGKNLCTIQCATVADCAGLDVVNGQDRSDCDVGVCKRACTSNTDCQSFGSNWQCNGNTNFCFTQ